MNYNDIKLNLNIKSICLFERLTGHNYFKLCGEDIPYLVYSMVITNNDIEIPYKVFLLMTENEKFSKVLAKKYKEIVDFNEQFHKVAEVNAEESGETEEKEMMTITELASNLIMKYGMDINYVMNEMQLWEIEAYAKTGTLLKQEELVDKRFWSYIQIAPQIDSKKIKKPEDLFKYAFEEDNKKKQAENTLKNISNKAFGQTIE